MNVRNYALVTAAYWAFTLTDGALRMLVLLHFARLGYGPVTLSFLFLFYEFFGIITNLLGGWLASRAGLRVTLLWGLFLQVAALLALTALDSAWPEWLAVTYTMAAQALSGIAKDLTKMSSKTAIKVLVPENERGRLFRWVALLTGSKNALKGVGFFLGGFLLQTLGYNGSLRAMAGALGLVWLASLLSLPTDLGKAKVKAGFRELFSKTREVNVLSGARFFLFGARDIWFVVGVPVFLHGTLGWSDSRVGTFMALWVVGYGIVQSAAPLVLRGTVPGGRAASLSALALAGLTAALPLALSWGAPAGPLLIGGLGLFGLVFALNSAIHSFLILDYTDGDKAALNVGFYYMANAGGRLVGCLLSGLLFQNFGLSGCLWGAFVFALLAALSSFALPAHALHPQRLSSAGIKVGEGE